MEDRYANAIISLSRHDDWQILMEYVEGAVTELERSLAMMDPTSAIDISRVQGARNALFNFLELEDSAHQSRIKEES